MRLALQLAAVAVALAACADPYSRQLNGTTVEEAMRFSQAARTVGLACATALAGGATSPGILVGSGFTKRTKGARVFGKRVPGGAGEIAEQGLITVTLPSLNDRQPTCSVTITGYSLTINEVFRSSFWWSAREPGRNDALVVTGTSREGFAEMFMQLRQ